MQFIFIIGITHEDMKKVTKALHELGFQKKGRYFNRPQCSYFVEFVSPPVIVGDKPIHNFEFYQTKLGIIKMLTPTDCVKDRLASFYHWDDKQALEQALIVSKEMKKKIDLDEIKRWSEKEGHVEKFAHFQSKLSSQKK